MNQSNGIKRKKVNFLEFDGIDWGMVELSCLLHQKFHFWIAEWLVIGFDSNKANEFNQSIKPFSYWSIKTSQVSLFLLQLNLSFYEWRKVSLSYLLKKVNDWKIKLIEKINKVCFVFDKWIELLFVSLLCGRKATAPTNNQQQFSSRPQQSKQQPHQQTNLSTI